MTVALKVPRVVVVTRATPLEHLLERHATLGQVRFFLESRGQSIELLQERQAEHDGALLEVERVIPTSWRRTRVRRRELDRFLFEPDDLIVAVGQDGLVANIAKYLKGQLVIGVNPSPQLYDGVLVRHPWAAVEELLDLAAAEQLPVEERTMVEARLDDGQSLLALNEVFVGRETHQSAIYRIDDGEREERQSSSGLIVTTGTGATGWARSIHRQRRSRTELPEPTEERLAFFVREAFPSVATQADLTEGTITAGRRLVVRSEMEESGVVFGDGIESDRLRFLWGQRLDVFVSARRLRLATA